MCLRILFCLFLLAGSLPAAAQTLTDSVNIDGHYRTFHYSTPAKSLRKPSLVFVLHGSGGDGLGMMKSTAKMEKQAVTDNALLVYPDGYKRYWNECRKSSPAAANVEDVNEQEFFSAMIAYFQKKYNADPGHVFAVGTSGGGHMTYKLALTMPNRFRAVTAIIANLPDTTNLDCVPSGKPIPILIINGTQDPVNPYNGGEVITGNMRMGVVRSTDRTFAYWASLAGYTGQPTHETLPDTDPSDGKTIDRYDYRETGKPEVELLRVNNGKHDYPNDIDVHLEALAFFMRQIR